MKTRTSILVIAVVAVCGAIAFVSVGSGDDNAATAAPRVSAAHHTAPHAVAPVLPIVAAPVLKDDTEYPVDPTPASSEAPLTEEEQDPRMVRSIEIIDQAITRADARLAAAEAAGDTTAATTARVRIKRLNDVRKQRATELGSMR